MHVLRQPLGQLAHILDAPHVGGECGLLSLDAPGHRFALPACGRGG